MRQSSLMAAAVCWLAVWMVSCSDKNLAGNATQTGNPTIAGVIYKPDGKTPACGAKVYLHVKNSLLDTFAIKLMSRFADTATASADAHGRFAIKSVDTGSYVIECTDGVNSVAVIDPVQITRTDETKNLPPVTLKPAGAIKGVVKLTGGGDPRKVLVLVFSVDKYAKVNADGSFTVLSLAEGDYDLRLLPCLEHYEVLDTTHIRVTSADTADLGVIVVPFSGIPVPRGVAVRLDTLKQVVMLSWSGDDSALVKGYYVYRRSVDSNTVFERINLHPVTDTLYRDNGGSQGELYEYRIAAIDQNATEGVKSVGVTIRIVSRFSVDAIFGKCGTQPGKLSLPLALSVAAGGLAYVIDNAAQPRIQVFDTNFVFIRQFGETVLSQPGDIATTADGRIVVADCGLQQILIFNRADSLSMPGIDVADVNNLTVDGKDRIITTSGEDSVYVFSASGTLLRKWGGSGASSGRFDQPTFVATDSNDNSYICDSDNKRIQVFDSSGAFKSSFTVSEHINGLAVESQTGRVFTVSDMGNFLDVYTQHGELVSHYAFLQYGLFNMPCGIGINGKAVYVALSGVCKIVKLINNLP